MAHRGPDCLPAAQGGWQGSAYFEIIGPLPPSCWTEPFDPLPPANRGSPRPPRHHRRPAKVFFFFFLFFSFFLAGFKTPRGTLKKLSFTSKRGNNNRHEGKRYHKQTKNARGQLWNTSYLETWTKFPNAEGQTRFVYV